MNDLTGRTLGKYDITKVLGEGSRGTVYLAHDEFIGRDVAIKVANPDALTEEERAVRYRKLSSTRLRWRGMLRHPNIVSVYDAGVEDDIWYIVMEYVAGERALDTHIMTDNLLPVQDVVRILFKCAKALDFAHRKGVVHRDVKPKNILLTGEQEGEDR